MNDIKSLSIGIIRLSLLETLRSLRSLRLNHSDATGIDIIYLDDFSASIPARDLRRERGRSHYIIPMLPDLISAMNVLKQEGLYVDVPPPDLILLDLNLPKKTGLEMLAEIKSAPKLKMIPVVIMTTSAFDEEILKSYARSARCYITKPVDFSQVANLVRWIEDLWLAVVTAPK
ncbi:response regulator [Microcoleus sp. N9_A1]|uniref:response regulator n=1 Tax=Microcoleus sp. N9_A1 TaxID=3055380 RepID=UPI002FD68FA0